MDVTPALRAHVREQFDQVRHLFDGKNLHAHVIMGIERGRHRAEMVLKWHNQTLTAHAVSQDMYLSLSKTVDKLEKQVLKLKTKMIDKTHKAEKFAKMKPEVPVAPADFRLVAERGYKVKAMLPEQAAAAAASGNAAFVLFRNKANDRISVVYKKKEGEYGLITA